MTFSGSKVKIFMFLKIILSAFLVTVALLFTVASIRTLSLDVNVGLQLANWEKTNNISLVIEPHQREQLLANFKEAIRIPTVSFSQTEINTTALLEFDSFLRKAFPTVFSSSLVHHESVGNYSHLFRVQGSQPDLVPYLLLAHIDVVPATESDGWEAPPFSAKEMDGFIYGRGTIDDKGSVMGILQALEYLLIKGYAPRRGFYIGLGHDEEAGRWLLLNRDKLLERKPDTNAFVRTTTAVTMFNAGVKVNVLPSLAEAYVNLRIHSAQSLQEVMDLIHATVGDQRVKIELVDGFDPLPVSSADEKSFGFQIIKKTVLDMFPAVTVAPGICVGNTDSRHFKDLTSNIYRFAPSWFKPGDPQRFHGINERISKKNYEEFVVFYFNLIQNCDIRKLPEPHSSVHEL
ncbi:N-fatty-acyl-amino acid synthase/hydrolase PM20D1.2 [Stegastes partitus]|uniref:N-fatty-acyl-amino acid synthase/hydrolase PM20D1.2 n=1 Tax=Stegastes partitus TaxID=144197 RepID=A0A9Y4JR72_9TELE|nr:PREDICTED: probable carboxypeptidase PM20D1 [Stegastes partitus]